MTRREQGNVLLTAEIDLAACQGRFVVAVGFGRNEHEAGHRACASLLQGLMLPANFTLPIGSTGSRGCYR